VGACGHGRMVLLQLPMQSVPIMARCTRYNIMW